MRHKVIAAENVKILCAVCTKSYIFACLLHLYVGQPPELYGSPLVPKQDIYYNG